MTQDIKDALRSTSDASAPGTDGIGWAIIKNLARNATALNGLLRFVQHIIYTGQWPQSLK
jgi:hypothetical protein